MKKILGLILFLGASLLQVIAENVQVAGPDAVENFLKNE